MELEGNYVYCPRLNINNEFNYYKVYNMFTYEYYLFSDGYDNLFARLEESSFNKVNDAKYCLKTELLEANSSYISTLFYGNPGFVVSEFSIEQTKKGLRLNANASFESTSKTYTYVMSGLVLDAGENVKVDYKQLPFEDVVDNEFDAMVEALKGHNYTATIVEDDGLDIYESSFYSNEDKIYYEVNGIKAGFYVTSEDLVQEITKKDESFYKVGKPMEGSLSEIMPTFEFARETFDLVKGKYSLKHGVEADFSVFTILQIESEFIDELTIEILEDSYVVTNTYDDCITTITFTDIGTTDVGYNVEDVLEPIVGTTWKDVTDETGYQFLVDTIGEENASLIPVPEGYNSWIQFSEEEGFVMFVARPSLTFEDDIVSYYYALQDAGFYCGEDGNLGGLYGAIETEDGNVLIVEFLEYEGLFCVCIYFEE